MINTFLAYLPVISPQVIEFMHFSLLHYDPVPCKMLGPSYENTESVGYLV